MTTLQKLFVFGDSLADSGNSGILTSGAVTPPPYFENRYSNGPVAVEQLWQIFNPGDASFRPSLHPGGTNYAIGGSTTGKENNVGVEAPIFADLGVAWQLSGYQTANAVFNPDTTLFVVSVFPNDVFFNLKTGLSSGTYNGQDGTPLALNLVPAHGVANIRGTVLTLLASGAKNLLVMNSPDLSKVPAFLGTPLAQQMAQISDDFNTKLEVEITAIATAHPAADISLYRLDQQLNGIIQNPDSYGFINVKQPCLANGSMCSDPSKYLFWDALHPTTTAHGLIAQGMAKDVPGPLPFIGAYSVFAWSRRLRQRLQDSRNIS